MTIADFSFIDDAVANGDRSQQLPVVFMHAFPYHSGMWEPQRAALRGRARFIAFDARGLGTRSESATSYLLEHTVDDLLALLDRLELERVVLCGLSMGGYAALRAVQRAPERVLGLILADTQAASDTDAAKLGRADALRVLARDGVEVFAKQQVGRQLSPHTIAQRPEIVELLTRMIKAERPEGIAASSVAIATRTDTSAALAQIKAPTRVIVGADDTLAPPSAAKQLAAGIAGADLHVLEHAGHISNLEARDEFNRLLLEHLDKLR